MKKLHLMVPVMFITCILLMLSTYIPNVYKIEKGIVPERAYEKILQHYQTLLPKEEGLVRSIVMLSDIEKKTPGDVIQARALSLLNNARTQTLSMDEKTLIAAHMRTMYDMEQEPVVIKGNVNVLRIGLTSMIVLLAGIDILILKKKRR